MRQRLIVGNWKMFTTAATARRLAADVVRGLGSVTRVRVALCPPAPLREPPPDPEARRGDQGAVAPGKGGVVPPGRLKPGIEGRVDGPCGP